jgi:hypothetical protein
VSNEMTIVDQEPQPPAVRHADTRGGIMATISVDLPALLTEFSERRRLFREWLLSNMEEGVHYGVVPGTGGKGGNDPQYRKLPSLYQPGADLVVELMNVRAEFEPDPVAWQQLGSKPGVVCYKCRLISRDGQVIGEGNGADKVGNKQRDEHAATMMACKRAKVSAVRTTYSLTDLFSQDLEDLQREAPDAPSQAPDAPTAQPRGQRVTVENLKQLYQAWRAYHEHDDTKDAKALFVAWQTPITGIPTEVAHKPENWTPLKLSECYARLAP